MAFLLFIADTLLFYNLALSIFGGVRGLRAHGIGGALAQRAHLRAIRSNAIEKLPIGDAVGSKGSPEATDKARAWEGVRDLILSELYTRDLITEAEFATLVVADIADLPLLPQNREATRRLLFFAR